MKNQKILAKKGYARFIGQILCGICLIISPTGLFAQEIAVDNTETENAARYYSKAFDLLRYPESEAIASQLRGVIKNGWQKEHEELEKVLAENEACFTEFKNGLTFEKCDFNFGKKYKYLAQRELPPLLEIKNLSNLLLLEGRYYEKEEKSDKAIDVYLSSLSFSKHISQDNALVSKIIALAIEKGVYPLLRQYLGSGEIDKQTLIRTLDYLTRYEKEHFPAKKLVEAEKEFFISNIEMLRDETEEKAREEQGFNEKKREAAEALGKELIIQAQELAEGYYGNFAKAIETNEEADWNHATAELDTLIKTSTSAISHIKDASGILYDAFTKDAEGSTKLIARKVIALTLSIAIPDFKKAARSYYETSTALKDLNASLSQILSPMPMRP